MDWPQSLGQGHDRDSLRVNVFDNRLDLMESMIVLGSMARNHEAGFKASFRAFAMSERAPRILHSLRKTSRGMATLWSREGPSRNS
jgi:hypothetical protein